MELKYSWHTKGNAADLFKLYLYGIEISDMTRFGLEDSSVQIVPLWNWNSRILFCYSVYYGFKLYLYGIEIKCKIRDIRQYCRFKLYLYGIEIYIWIFRKIAVLFKLYLYGIEMQVFWCADLMPSVQIVPLWNWNWFSTFIIMRFKNVQIVPLWNWNTLSLLSRLEIIGPEKARI